jgi:hypothetical protein
VLLVSFRTIPLEKNPETWTDYLNDGFRLLKDTMPSNDNTYHKFIKYFEKEYMKRTSMAFWHHGSNDMKTNNSLEGKPFDCISLYLPAVVFLFL